MWTFFTECLPDLDNYCVDELVGGGSVINGAYGSTFFKQTPCSWRCSTNTFIFI